MTSAANKQKEKQKKKTRGPKLPSLVFSTCNADSSPTNPPPVGAAAAGGLRAGRDLLRLHRTRQSPRGLLDPPVDCLNAVITLNVVSREELRELQEGKTS